MGLTTDLKVRIGMNTGNALVGMMGSIKKLNYTIIGDSVNLASRLEGANKQYGTFTMISESTYLEAKDKIIARPLDLLRVKGKKLPTSVYELMAKKGSWPNRPGSAGSLPPGNGSVSKTGFRHRSSGIREGAADPPRGRTVRGVPGSVPAVPEQSACG